MSPINEVLIEKIQAGVAQLEEAMVLDAIQCEFESHHLYQNCNVADQVMRLPVKEQDAGSSPAIAARNDKG